MKTRFTALDTPWAYGFLRPYVDWVFRRSYRSYACRGIENIPTDGAVIFAPNHTNALCDAMAVLSMSPQAKVFAARADIFNSRALARVLAFFKIIPIRRMRDGVEAVRHNDETFDMATEALRRGMSFCIFSEGTHRAERGLIIPLSKGIFRIALQARQTIDKVYIVPVGVNYGDFFHLWDRLDITIGQPIRVDDNGEPLSRQINALREKLTPAMYSLVWTHGEEQKPVVSHRWLRIAMLCLLAPLALVCAAGSMVIWLPMLFVRRMVEDRAFHNSIQYVLQLIFYTLSLGLVGMFSRGWQEWCYQCRILKS